PPRRRPGVAAGGRTGVRRRGAERTGAGRMSVAILVYHRIVAGPAGGVHDVPEERFGRHLAALVALGARPEDGPLLRLPDGRGVILTFDDATSDHLAAAARLEERGWRGLFFVPAGRIGEPGRLTAAELSGLAARGH